MGHQHTESDLGDSLVRGPVEEAGDSKPRKRESVSKQAVGEEGTSTPVD